MGRYWLQLSGIEKHFNSILKFKICFQVGGDGLIYEGRGWNKTGTHTIGFNDRSIGISFIGTYISNYI